MTGKNGGQDMIEYISQEASAVPFNITQEGVPDLFRSWDEFRKPVLSTA